MSTEPRPYRFDIALQQASAGAMDREAVERWARWAHAVAGATAAYAEEFDKVLETEPQAS